MSISFISLLRHLKPMAGILMILFCTSSHAVFAQKNSTGLKFTDSQSVNRLLKTLNDASRLDTPKTLQQLEAALQFATSSQWDHGCVKIFMRMGIIYGRSNRQQDAKVCYRNAFDLAAVQRDSNNCAESAQVLAFLFQLENRQDSALWYYDQALKFRSEPRLRVSLLAGKAMVYNEIGDYPQTLQGLQQAGRLNQQVLQSGKANHDDSLTQAGLWFSMGNVYIEMGQYEDAGNLYKQVINLSNQLGDDYIGNEANSGLGRILFLKELYPEAILQYQKALQVCVQKLNHYREAAIRSDLGGVYLNMGKIDEALEQAMMASRIAETHKDGDIIRNNLILLGRIFNKRKMPSAAIGYLEQAVSKSRYDKALADERDAWQALSESYTASGKFQGALQAFQQYVKLRDSIFNLEKARDMTRSDMQFTFETRRFQDSVNQSAAFNLRLQRQRLFTWSGFIGVVLFALVAVMLYYNMNRQKKANRIIKEAHDQIRKEKLISEELLLNILPPGVAEELKSKGKVKAREFEHVTVLFTDFVNFTQKTENMNPQDLIEELDTCFKAFDAICQECRLEKIKTVGDAYLAVSGLPIAQPKHASLVVEAAFRMRDYMRKRKIEKGESTFDIRFGVHSGRVMAGVVGLRKFAYDVWGDTVNTAARMEQHGEPDKINISQTTRDLVADQYVFIDRGELEAKHKGLMKMYFVEPLTFGGSA